MANSLLQFRAWLAELVGGRLDDRGASLVEYALLLVLIAVVCFVAVGFLGQTTNSGISSTASGFP